MDFLKQMLSTWNSIFMSNFNILLKGANTAKNNNISVRDI